MAVKNALPCNFHLNGGWNGEFRGNDPYGVRASGYQTAPTLLFTSVTSGSTTGFENNKGCYLYLFGYSFGRQDALGTASGARVFIGGVEVDNYRCLNEARTFDKNQIERIGVQVGALGGQTGALDVEVTVNGVSAGVLTGGFYVQPGRCAYVSLTGNDATAMFDNPSLPFRYVQNYGGGASPVAGSLWAATTAMGETGLRAGDTICPRAGTWTDQVGANSRWVRFYTHTGSAPNGAAGNGPINFVRHPGPVLGHAPEDVYHTGGASDGGGIHGPNSTQAGLGYGKYWTVTGFRLESNNTVADTDASGLSVENGTADYCRFVDIDASWPTANTDSVNGAKSASIEIASLTNGFIGGCYVHDTAGGNHNHGIYGSGAVSSTVISYNWIEDCTGGTGLQLHTTGDAGTFGTGNSIHHNWIEYTTKYGINLNLRTKSCDVFNNVVLNTGWDAISISTSAAATSIAFNVAHNTIYKWSQRNGGETFGYGAFRIDVNDAVTGAIKFAHNICVMPSPNPASASSAYYDTINTNAGITISCYRNLYYDFAGVKTTRPSIDDGTSTIGSDPLFTDLTNGDYTLQSGSPARNAATGTEPCTVSTDFYGMLRTEGAAPDIGATEGVGV